MADIADSANDISQLEIESILKDRVVEKPAYYQVCRYCKEPTPDGYPFCNSDCLKDFEGLNKKRGLE
ncbi:hypothetical protein RHO14_09015 [Orbus wheelerorum]|uniref:hypothetical protein n=1 Tax=Orbus wheelerorum TaxID=3074111 RepID=UPI00370D5B96